MKKISTSLLAVAMLLFVSACNEKVSQSVNTQVRQEYREASQSFERAKNPLKRTTDDTVSRSAGVWLGDSSVKQEHKEPLPAILETPMGITFIADEEKTLKEITGEIENLTGIQVMIDDLIEEQSLERIKLKHTGPLSELLTTIATELGLYWFHENEKITFYKQETKTFTLYALPTDTSYNSVIGSDEGENLSIQTSANLKEWEEIENALKGIVQTGNISISRSTGTITVTSGPSTLARVGKYIREQNRRLSKLVTISVRVIQVSLDDENSVGINWNAFFANASGLKLASETVNPFSTNEGIQSISVEVDPTTTGSLADAAGSKSALNALAKQGKISVVTSATVTTRNNRIAPVNSTQTFKYVDSFSTSAQSDNFNTTDFKPEEETIGFGMQLLPNILENGRVLVMFNMSLRELLSWDEQSFGSGDNAIKVRMPRIDERSFRQELVLKSGQTLIMTGFEKTRNGDTRYGVGDPNFMGLGGGRDTQSSRDILVVMLTPQVLQSPLDREERMSNQWGTPPY
ncbi:MAG: hypothetical protein JW812_01050 [Alphaproteobacteria bacterium]|nr:hypothetical protein [Alphaproteobacteria bacterium]MBN2779545.1 hypothetical protein [Alphaproteobacteria bacterium]